MKVQDWIWAFIRILIGAILAYAGFTKLMDPIENFRGVIAQYHVIPYAFVPLVAAVMPWVEFLTGVLMILGYAPRWVSAAAAILHFGFLMVMASSPSFFTSGGQDCGCFGEGSLIHLSVRQMFLIDSINFVLSIRLAMLKHHAFSLDIRFNRAH